MVKRIKYRLIFIALILIIWEVLAQSGLYHKVLIPSLFTILETLISELMNGKLFYAVLNSLLIISKGLFISLLVAFVLVGISRINEITDDLVSFMISIAHPVPGIAILPLIILWFGIGEKAVLFVVVHAMVWPLVINIMSEMNRLDEKYSKIARVFNLGFFSEVIHIYLIGSVPAFISGSKIAWSRGWRAFISAEMVFGVVGANSGLGWYLFEQRVYMNSPALYSGLIAIVLSGIFIEGYVFSKLEKVTRTRWTM